MTDDQKQLEEEFAGLHPVKTGVTQPHLLQWIDPTFDAAEPHIDSWLEKRKAA